MTQLIFLKHDSHVVGLAAKIFDDIFLTWIEDVSPYIIRQVHERFKLGTISHGLGTWN